MKEEHASIFLLYVVVVISDTQQTLIVSTSEQSQAKLFPRLEPGPLEQKAVALQLEPTPWMKQDKILFYSKIGATGYLIK